MAAVGGAASTAYRDIIVVMVFDLAAALHLAHAPIASRPALQHVDTNPYTGMLECGLKDCRERAVGHQSSRMCDGCGVLPGLFLD